MLVVPPPPQPVVKAEATSEVTSIPLSRNRLGSMSHLLRVSFHRGPEVFYLVHYLVGSSLQLPWRAARQLAHTVIRFSELSRSISFATGCDEPAGLRMCGNSGSGNYPWRTCSRVVFVSKL